MHDLLLQNARVVGLPDGDVYISGGKIASFEGIEKTIGQIIDLAGHYLFPGFIDIHNHGAMGADVNSASADDLIGVGRFLASKGVTGWLPTLVPDSDENYRRQIGEIEKAMAAQAGMAVAQILGVHYEGVFANEKMCGALRPEFFKTFKNGDEVSHLPRLSSGVHMTTLAPEVENGIEVVKELRRQGWVVSIGHTKADTATLDSAFVAGAHHMTHFFNAMTGLHHREIGVAGWGLTNREVTFDIIADGIHVAKPMLELACSVKGVDKVSLISDSIAPTGQGDGEYEIWGEKILVVEGRTQNERGRIAGSVITSLEAAKNMMSLGFSPEDVARMASLNPARLIRIADRGSIKLGQRGDLVAMDGEGNVRLSLVGGQVAFGDL